MKMLQTDHERSRPQSRAAELACFDRRARSVLQGKVAVRWRCSLTALEHDEVEPCRERRGRPSRGEACQSQLASRASTRHHDEALSWRSRMHTSACDERVTGAIPGRCAVNPHSNRSDTMQTPRELLARLSEELDHVGLLARGDVAAFTVDAVVLLADERHAAANEVN